MATNILNASIDCGPQDCRIQHLNWNSPKAWSKLLQFSLDYKNLATQLYHLIKSYKSEIMMKKQHVHRQLITISVAKWIHCTNKIELAGLDTERDTEALIRGHRLNLNTVQKKEVLQTFKLLQKTYTSNDDLRQYKITPEKLDEWHHILFDSLLDTPGTFRKGGVKAEPYKLGMEVHFYPHHSLLPGAIWRLCKLTSSLIEHIAKTTEVGSVDRLLKTFALAAFVQFHFDDIHPFVGGNGSLCIFLSKYILDTVCPLPIPMFEQKILYLDALVEGRSLSPENSPKPLFVLLLETAQKFYQECLQLYTDYEVCFTLIADTGDTLQMHMQKLGEISDSDQITILETFKSLKEGETKQIKIGETKFTLKRELQINLDDL